MLLPLQEEDRRGAVEKQERLLEKEKNRISTELMALQAKKSDSTDPTEELERELEVAKEVGANQITRFTLL